MRLKLKKLTASLLTAALSAAMFAAMPLPTANADAVPVRIKDIAKVQGVRSNQLSGYGLVVGLNGSGDSTKSTHMLQSIVNMMNSFGVTISQASLKPKNVAAVMVTATLPPFVREGDTIDVTVSSIGDAKSIQGGTLVQTPLRAGNGTVYAVAQGAVSTGGFMAGNGGGNSVQKNFPTVGLSPNGAIVERSVEDDLTGLTKLSLSLLKADFTTASRIANSINSRYGPISRATNPGRIDISVPNYYQNNVVTFVANLEELTITPDSVAKIVVNERTGTIVMGGGVTVDDVAITQGGLTINIRTGKDVYNPPFGLGNTIVNEKKEVEAKEEPANSIVLSGTTDINDIVGALNSVGATPRDIISILQAMKASGALHAELEII